MPQRPRLGTRESGTRDSFAQSEPRRPDGAPAASQGPSGGGALEGERGRGHPKAVGVGREDSAEAWVCCSRAGEWGVGAMSLACAWLARQSSSRMRERVEMCVG